MMNHIPLVDLVAAQQEVMPELEEDLREVLASAHFVGGPAVEEFERAYASFVGVGHCVGVANGTDALELALRALEVAGGEVVIPANTFIATAEAVVRAGGVPVLVDVDPQTLLMDPAQVSNKVGPRTRAVVPVHLYGQIAPVEQIEQALGGRDVPIVEDAAQSQGAQRLGRTSGAFGAIAATSFYPGKNLGAAGDAGAVTTDREDLARRVRTLGNHGSARKYQHDVLGSNSRLDAVQAVVLLHKLRRLVLWNERRARLAQHYLHLLREIEGVGLPQTAAGNSHVWHLFVVRVRDRDRVLKELNQAGVGAAIHYPVPLHQTEALRPWQLDKDTYPHAERAAQEILSLPMHPHLTSNQQQRVVDILREALSP